MSTLVKTKDVADCKIGEVLNCILFSVKQVWYCCFLAFFFKQLLLAVCVDNNGLCRKGANE